ncbi:hypothetical protein FOL46_009765, partial [Perkinsus olseni]
RGAGTILTGTVISGMVRVGQDVVILDSTTGKMASSSSTTTTGGSSKNNKVIVKSIQMFKKNVKTASEGARCALCIPGINANTLERGIIMSTPPPPPAAGGGGAYDNNNDDYDDKMGDNDNTTRYRAVTGLLAAVDKIRYGRSKSRTINQPVYVDNVDAAANEYFQRKGLDPSKMMMVRKSSKVTEVKYGDMYK